MRRLGRLALAGVLALADAKGNGVAPCISCRFQESVFPSCAARLPPYPRYIYECGVAETGRHSMYCRALVSGPALKAMVR